MRAAAATLWREPRLLEAFNPLPMRVRILRARLHVHPISLRPVAVSDSGVAPSGRELLPISFCSQQEVELLFLSWGKFARVVVYKDPVLRIGGDPSQPLDLIRKTHQAWSSAATNDRMSAVVCNHRVHQRAKQFDVPSLYFVAT